MVFSCDKTVVFLCSLCSSGMVNVRLCSFNTDQPFLAGFFIYFCLSCKNVMFGVFLIKMGMIDCGLVTDVVIVFYF